MLFVFLGCAVLLVGLIGAATAAAAPAPSLAVNTGPTNIIGSVVPGYPCPAPDAGTDEYVVVNLYAPGNGSVVLDYQRTAPNGSWDNLVFHIPARSTGTYTVKLSCRELPSGQPVPLQGSADWGNTTQTYPELPYQATRVSTIGIAPNPAAPGETLTLTPSGPCTVIPGGPTAPTVTISLAYSSGKTYQTP